MQTTLTFRLTDDLGIALWQAKPIPESVSLRCEQLGPLAELLQHRGKVPDGWWTEEGVLRLGRYRHLVNAVRDPTSDQFTSADRKLAMLKVAVIADRPAGNEVAAFNMRAKKAGIEAGLSGEWAAGMVAGIGEMISNVEEHSQAVATAFAAYESRPGTFEFVVADLGVGVLSTLRDSSDYANLADDAEALRLALTDGVSRLGAGQGRGRGFRDLFRGLANRRGHLRFRSGRGGLVIDGTSPSLMSAHPGDKPPIKGFFVSVTCHAT